MRAHTRLRASLTQCTGQWYACQGKKPRPLSYQTFVHSLKEERKLQKVTLWTSLIAIYLYSIPQFLLLPVPLFLLFFLDSTGKRQKTKQTFLCTADFSLHLLHFYFLYSLSEIATPLCCFWHSTWDEKHGPSSCKLFSSLSLLIQSCYRPSNSTIYDHLI